MIQPGSDAITGADMAAAEQTNPAFTADSPPRVRLRTDDVQTRQVERDRLRETRAPNPGLDSDEQVDGVTLDDDRPVTPPVVFVIPQQKLQVRGERPTHYSTRATPAEPSLVHPVRLSDALNS